jgi:hypothetical protein
MKTTLAVAAFLAVAVLGSANAYAFDQTVIPFAPGDPSVNGCPAGWEMLKVADLNPYGYVLPSIIDSLANGGNGDHKVCGKPLSAAEMAARFPDARVPIIFDFRDNSLNAYTVEGA